jgi:DNA repair ATPase RecN
MNDRNELDLGTSIAHLRAVKLKLLDIDEDELNQDQKNELAEQLNECSTAIRTLENADLENLADEFKSSEPELREAAGKLEDDLRALDEAVAVLNTVSAGLKTITGVVRLLG